MVPTSSEWPQIEAAELRRVLDLYERGLVVQAYRRAEAFAPLKEWRGREPRLLAGRLAANVGSPRLSRAMYYLAWRENQSDPETLTYFIRAVHERCGPYAAWRFWNRFGDLEHAPGPTRADWLASRATIAAHLRDFETADQFLWQALALAPDRPWLCVEQAYVLEQEDRYTEALAAAKRALELSPCYRPGVQSAAHMLGLLDRNREALDLLREASEQIESGLIVAQLAMLETEMGMFEEARRQLEKLLELLPLREKDVEQWLMGHRSDAAYYCGDTAKAAELARQAGGEFHRKVAEELSNQRAGRKRVLLPVGFVRQHHMTCAPATLSALSRFWSMPAEHVSIAEAICFDGTPAHSERRWAEENGWRVREFTVSWESAVALLDRGVPFTLTTVEAAGAHLQAVIGYDSRRGTLLIRDPYLRHFGEFIADAFFDRYRSTGPRGMALVPWERGNLLEGIKLPDAWLYDLFYEMHAAMLKHNREAAATACEKLALAAPQHRLTLWARRSLAVYDGDAAAQLRWVERLLELYPSDALLLLQKLNLLRDLGRRDERLAILETQCEKRNPDPLFLQQYAQELAADARESARAMWLLRKCLRICQTEPGSYFVLANTLWSQRQFEEALELYRFATCLNDKDDQLAMVYFNATRQLKQTDRAMRLLRDRFDRFGARSSQPARTLFQAAAMVERTVEAFDVLEQALKLRPEDGDLLLHAADAHARYGKFAQAEALLASARDRCKRADWLRVCANLASYRGELKSALELWRQVLECEPLSIDAHRAAAQLLAETSGRSAAIDHLRQAAKRFGHYVPVHLLLIEWLREEEPDEAEKAIRHLIEINSADAAAHRQLAGLLLRQHRDPEALLAAEQALRLAPHSSWSRSTVARVLQAMGRMDEARRNAREAIRLSVDNDDAISLLLEESHDVAQRREALSFIKRELMRQITFGDGLLAYRFHARQTLGAEEVLAELREALAARPDLWQAWVAVVRQLADSGQLAEAVEIAKQATKRFPLLPQVWLDLSVVQQLSGDAEGEVESLRQVLQISPTWGFAVRQLAAVHERLHEMPKARELLEQAVAWAPMDGLNHAALAEVLWRMGGKDEAIERLRHAIRLAPGEDWCWRRLREWAEELRRPEIAVEMARELTRKRGGEAQSWLVLARMLGADEMDERIAAVEQAVNLEPRNVEAHDLRAALLARARRFAEARAACRPPALGEQPPMQLRGREVWILWAEGKAQEAIAAMRRLVDEDARFVFGWYQLAEWYREMNDNERYLAAAEEIRRLTPHDVTPYMQIGEAQERLKNAAAAEEAYRRALELEPDNHFAGMSLMALQLEAKEFDSAAKTLAHLRRHADGDPVTAREVQLLAQTGREERARELFTQLCRSATADAWSIDTAFEAVRNLDPAAAGRMLYELVTSEPVNPHVGEMWVDRLARRKAWGRIEMGLRRMHDALPPADGRLRPVVQQAIARYLDALAEGGATRRLRWFVWRNKKMLRSNALCWGMVGHALLTSGRYGQAVKWLGDWQGRAGVEQWMLANLAESLRAVGEDEQAGEVSGAALKLWRDGTRHMHAIWLALDEALAGDATAAMARLSVVQARSLDGFHRFLQRLIDAVIDVQRIAKSDRQQAYHVGQKLLEEATREWPGYRTSAPLRRSYKRVVRWMRRECGRGWWG